MNFIHNIYVICLYDSYNKYNKFTLYDLFCIGYTVWFERFLLTRSRLHMNIIYKNLAYIHTYEILTREKLYVFFLHIIKSLCILPFYFLCIYKIIVHIVHCINIYIAASI